LPCDDVQRAAADLFQKPRISQSKNAQDIKARKVVL
jgi:hypothetical protein